MFRDAGEDIKNGFVHGLVVQMTSAELTEYAAKRAQFHHGHAKGYREQIEKIKALQKASEAETSLVGKGGNRDPAAELETQATNHERKGRYFEFVSKHIVPDKTYLLHKVDLAELEIAPSHGY